MFALPRLLFFIGLVSAAVIAAPFHHPKNFGVEESAGELVPSVPTQSPSSQSARHDDSSHTKREPYYFPETIPSRHEIEERLTSMREAGFVKSSRPDINHKQQHESISTPDAVIDIPHSLPTPNSDSTSHRSTPELTWEGPPFKFPLLSFLAFSALGACIATIIRDVKNNSDHDNALKA